MSDNKGYPPMQQQQPPSYPNPAYNGNDSYPAQGQTPPVHMQAPPAQHMPSSDAQLGEQYRSQLFARCAQGIHEPTTKYGICGIITAVVCFPCGLICLFMDTEQKCDRCGIRLAK